MSDPRSRLAELAGGEAPRSSIPSVDNIDAAVLPRAPDRYRTFTSITPVLSPKPVPLDSVLEESGQLSELVDLSLVEAKKLIEEPWDFSDARFVSAKSSMIQTVLSTGVKVDDTNLRRRQTDMLPELLKLIAREEKALGKTLELQAS